MALVADDVAFAQVFDADGDVTHEEKRKVESGKLSGSGLVLGELVFDQLFAMGI